MSVVRQFNEEAGTVYLTYKGEPITPVMKLDDPQALLDGLTAALNHAYNKLRDAKLA